MIVKPVIDKKISPYTTNTNLLSVEWLEPSELLHPHRFDLLAKYIYAKYQRIKDGCSWQNQLYLDHIRIFNGFFEKDGSGKTGKAGFLDAYDEVLNSIASEDFDEGRGILPISRDGVLFDGAHRASACLHSGSKVACARSDNSGPCYDYQWFRERGLPEYWLDAMARELCRLKTNTFVVLVYPSACEKTAELNALLKKHGVLWYAKEVQLKGNGPVNLIRQVYANEPWVGGWYNAFAGARNKASWCFEGGSLLRVFLLESDLDRMLSLKKAVRDLYQVGNHSVHINDMHAETLQLADLLLNENSIHFMNHCNLVKRPWFWRLFQHYQTWHKQCGLNPEDYCIDGSSVMAAYGLRDSRDLDFLHLASNANTGFEEISSHNHEAYRYHESVANLITDPRSYFYYAGSKFLALPLVKSMKKRRGENKDIEDIELIDANALQGGLASRYNVRSLLALVSRRYYWSKLRMMAYKVRFFLRHSKKLMASSRSSPIDSK